METVFISNFQSSTVKKKKNYILVTCNYNEKHGQKIEHLYRDIFLDTCILQIIQSIMSPNEMCKT